MMRILGLPAPEELDDHEAVCEMWLRRDELALIAWGLILIAEGVLATGEDTRGWGDVAEALTVKILDARGPIG